MPPCAIESERSGMILSTLTTCSTPSPLQLLHIPLGELVKMNLVLV